MGLKTKEEYIESLRQMSPTAYMFGEKITNVLDNPRLRAGIEATAATYKVAELDEFRDLVVTKSPLINEPINRFVASLGGRVYKKYRIFEKRIA